jgi:hypothetical protein
MKKSKMDIKEIKENVKRNEYEISFHAEKERYAENITITDLENVIYNGEILEDYPDDVRGTSCLLLGHSQNRPIHIVCGYTPINWIRIITVYIPERPKWINERRRSKGGERDA